MATKPSPGEAKAGPPVYETDSFGVEIVPFNPAFPTYKDRTEPREVLYEGQRRQVHNLSPNFRANMNLYLRFLDGGEPTNLFEQATLQAYQTNGIEEHLRQMMVETPNLFADFAQEHKDWERVKLVRTQGPTATTEDIDFKFQTEARAQDPDRMVQRAVYESSAYAYLAPRMRVDTPRVLNT